MIFNIWLVGYIVCCILVLVAVMVEDDEKDYAPSKYFGMILVGFIILSPIWFIVIPASAIASKLD